MTAHPDASQIAREIRAGLEGVTPGPWKWDTDYSSLDSGEDHIIWPLNVPSDPLSAKEALGACGDKSEDQAAANAAHIANCSPDRITILLDAFDAQAKEIAELREALKPFVALLRWFDGSPEFVYSDETIAAVVGLTGSLKLTVGDLRRARSALRAKQENPNG